MQMLKNVQISNQNLTLIFPAAKQMFVVQSPAFVPVTSEIWVWARLRTHRVFARPRRICVAWFWGRVIQPKHHQPPALRSQFRRSLSSAMEARCIRDESNKRPGRTREGQGRGERIGNGCKTFSDIFLNALLIEAEPSKQPQHVTWSPNLPEPRFSSFTWPSNRCHGSAVNHDEFHREPEDPTNPRDFSPSTCARAFRQRLERGGQFHTQSLFQNYQDGKTAPLFAAWFMHRQLSEWVSAWGSLSV